jgi:hypothetical protein
MRRLACFILIKNIQKKREAHQHIGLVQSHQHAALAHMA